VLFEQMEYYGSLFSLGLLDANNLNFGDWTGIIQTSKIATTSPNCEYSFLVIQGHFRLYFSGTSHDIALKAIQRYAIQVVYLSTFILKFKWPEKYNREWPKDY